MTATAASTGAPPRTDPRAAPPDPYLKSMLLGLIEDSYLHTGTVTQFAAEVLQVVAYAVTVPVAFTEGFLRAYLSIERVIEEPDGRIVIVPKVGASEEDVIRDVDEILAEADPGAVFNPVVRARLDAVHQASGSAMKWDLDELRAWTTCSSWRCCARCRRIRSAATGKRRGHCATRPATWCAPSWTRCVATRAGSSRAVTRRARTRLQPLPRSDRLL